MQQDCKKTSDGKPKVIDIVDCSGSGDVEMTIAKVENGEIKAVTGRKFKVPDGWGEIRVGSKRAFELFPSGLINRVKKERKKLFEIQQDILVARLKTELTTLKSKSPDSKKEIADLEAQIETLQGWMKSFDDSGPIYDIFLIKRDLDWQVGVYVPPFDNFDPARKEEEVIDLTSVPFIGEFYKNQEYRSFSEQDVLNYSVNVYEEGSIVSIVTNAGSHGTHVAGIVGAYYGEESLNGIAPGCQIVAVRIGDLNLGSMETGTAVTRAIYHAKRSKCDLINMSYGEASAILDHNNSSSRLKRLFDSLVNEHGITFVASAGNNGPALSTVGCPGGCYSSAIGVGAFVSGDMMEAQYALRERLPDTQYTWSSRGPTPDGHLGVSISGCGAAISPIPTWTLQKSERMNGTSMSSPSACGGIALLMSGLKAKGMKWTPHWIRQAIEATARSVDNVHTLALGHGLLQVERAFEWLTEKPFSKEVILHRYEVHCDLPSGSGKGKTGRGIYLRELHEVSKPFETNVHVKVLLPELDSHQYNSNKLNFSKRVFLTCGDTKWITTPKYIMLTANENSFSVRVDPEQLTEGHVWSSRIEAYGEEGLEYGMLFSVPVTVVKPHVLAPNVNVVNIPNLDFIPGEIVRYFVVPPKGSTYIRVTVNENEEKQIDTHRIFVIHAVQLHPKKSFREGEFHQYFYMAQNERKEFAFDVTEGVTLELCLAQFWSSLGPSRLQASLEFFGITLPNELSLDAHKIAHRVEVSSYLRTMEIDIKCELTKFEKTLLPSSAEIKVHNDDRNKTLNGASTFEAIVEYKFTLDTTIDKFYPIVPVLSSILYESEFESQQVRLYDSHKQLIKTFDAWPEARKIKLTKGDYLLRLQIRHENSTLVEQWRERPIVITGALPKKITLSHYGTLNHALIDSGPKNQKKKISFGQTWPFFISTALFEKEVPDMKDIKADRLVGVLQYCDVHNKPTGIRGEKVGAIPLTVNLTFTPKKKENLKPKILDDLRTKLLDQNIEFLQKAIKDKEIKDDELEAVIDNLDSNYLPVLNLKLNFAQERKYDRIPLIADQIINSIDKQALAIYFGTQTKNKAVKEEQENEDPELAKKSKEMQRQKDSLAAALHAKLSYMLKSGQNQDTKDIMDQLRSWVDTTEEKYAVSDIKYERQHKRVGNVMKKLTKMINDNSNSKNVKELYEIMTEILKEQAWHHWIVYNEEQKAKRFPPSYNPF